jgi:hypothetical protein
LFCGFGTGPQAGKPWHRLDSRPPAPRSRPDEAVDEPAFGDRRLLLGTLSAPFLRGPEDVLPVRRGSSNVR